MTTVTADDRGRITIPKELRDDFGGKYRLVKLKSGLKLIPLSEDPVEGLREAVGDSMTDIDPEEVSEVAVEEAEKEAQL